MRDNELIALPKAIGDLQKMKELHIQGNRLTVLPPELGKWNFNFHDGNLTKTSCPDVTLGYAGAFWK